MIYKQTFDSIGEFLAHVDNAKSEKLESHKRKYKHSEFNEFEDWSECVHHLQHGWQKGVDAVNAKTSRLEQEVGGSVLREAFNPAITGLFFDVGLVMTGEPECWLETNQEDTGNRVVTLAINCSVSASISSKTIIERGAALCALIKLLETNGKSVRVVLGMGVNIGFSNPKTTDKIQTEIVLKQEGQPFDLDSMAFWLVCPDAFRRLLFRFLEEHPQFHRIRGNYGFPDTSYTPEGQIKMPAILSGETWTHEQTKAWLLKILAEQGVALS